MANLLVLYNAPTLPADHPHAAAEADVLNTADAVAGHLASVCHDVRRLGLAEDPMPLVELLKRLRPDAVFNLFEGTAVCGQTEAVVAGILEWFGVPFTGCPMPAMVLARDKALTKRLLRGAGLPTADFVLVEADRLADPPAPSAWPAIVKPSNEDASVGIDLGSVVEDLAGLKARLALLARTLRPPFLVEAFIDGREFNVGVIDDPGPTALPVAEIIFDERALARGDPRPCAGRSSWRPIVTYASKWEPGSPEDLAALPRCPAEVEPKLEGKLKELALAAYRLIGGRDYARIDFRTDAEGNPFILEVNPNPDYGPNAGLARMLAASGRSHREFTVRLAERLLRR